MTWVLIMTLWQSTYGGHAAIHSVDGFSSREECQVAKKHWMDSVSKKSGVTSVCVYKGARK